MNARIPLSDPVADEWMPLPHAALALKIADAAARKLLLTGVLGEPQLRGARWFVRRACVEAERQRISDAEQQRATADDPETNARASLEVTRDQVTAIYETLKAQRDGDPLGADTDLREFFRTGWPPTASRGIVLSTGRSISVFPLLQGPREIIPRLSVFHAFDLLDAIGMAARNWDQVPAWRPGEEEGLVRSLVWGTLRPPGVDREATMPTWLSEIPGVDVRLILGAALLPVVAAWRGLPLEAVAPVG